MTYSFDPVANFGLVTVLAGHTAGDTLITLGAGQGALLPDPSVVGAYPLTWWDATLYPNASDDPNKEIIRVTNISGDDLTGTRAQEGTSATSKNTAFSTYKMSLGFTKAMYDAITDAINDINPSIWLPMETLTFSGTSATQTTANFPNAATAKEYLVLVQADASTTNQNVGFRLNGSTTFNGYVIGQTNYNGTTISSYSDDYLRFFIGLR